MARRYPLRFATPAAIRGSHDGRIQTLEDRTKDQHVGIELFAYSQDII